MHLIDWCTPSAYFTLLCAEALLGREEQAALGHALLVALTKMKHTGTIDKTQAGLREMCTR